MIDILYPVFNLDEESSVRLSRSVRSLARNKYDYIIHFIDTGSKYSSEHYIHEIMGNVCFFEQCVNYDYIYQQSDKPVSFTFNFGFLKKVTQEEFITIERDFIVSPTFIVDMISNNKYGFFVTDFEEIERNIGLFQYEYLYEEIIKDIECVNRNYGCFIFNSSFYRKLNGWDERYLVGVGDEDLFIRANILAGKRVFKDNSKNRPKVIVFHQNHNRKKSSMISKDLSRIFSRARLYSEKKLKVNEIDGLTKNNKNVKDIWKELS